MATRSRPQIARLPAAPAFALWLAASACGAPPDTDDGARGVGELLADAVGGYCEVHAHGSDVLSLRPAESEAPIDDVNWFARPVPHDGADWIVAFASHDQNYLYNLTRGVRVRIPDRSDAVATPDGRYMTVPSTYTPDQTIRFYPMAPLLEALEAGRDAHDVEPAFVHRHPNMGGVYYQSTGVLGERSTAGRHVVDYRLMFSGGADESGFRIVDYAFVHDEANGDLVSVEASDPMALCPEVRHDLNTPFISKDGRYVAAYTSETPGNAHTPGASLKVFEITSTDPAAGSTTCRAVVDFGFAAGKADFSFDGDRLAFHISQGAYLTPFINGGLPSSTITDVVVARLQRNAAGDITGHGGVKRLTTSLDAGVGSYFPAFFPDGRLFYIANAVPRDSEAPKRFHFRVVDADAGPWDVGIFGSADQRAGWLAIEALWERACVTERPALAEAPFPLKEHEAPWQVLALSAGQCRALVEDARTSDSGQRDDWDQLAELCGSLGR